jgi:hypothetical protein
MPAGLGPVLQVNAGRQFSCVIKLDTTVLCWGFNPNNGQPVPAGLTSVAQVTSGYSFSCALKTNGTVVCWGFDGDDGEGMITVPAGLGSVVQISSGGYNTCALKSDGKIVCWGVNQDGQNNVPADLAAIAPQTISYTSTPPSPALNGGTYNVSATGGGSGNPVTFSSSGACSVTGSLVHFDAVGACTIAADQAGGNGYTAATQAIQSFTVASSAQAIAFTSIVPNPGLTGGTYNVSATGGLSGSPVTFTATGACSMSGGAVHLDAVGTCTVAANQSAGNGYSAAIEVTQSFSVVSSVDPLQLLQAAATQIDQLIANGGLSAGNGNSMKAKLNAASSSLANGNNNAALNQLNSLLNQLTTLAKTGKLAGPEADALRALIAEAIAAL